MFVGSVFSPYYARAVQRGGGRPQEHLAVNVALYGRRKRWAFVEQAGDFSAVTPRCLRVGRSRLRQLSDGWALDLHVPRKPWQRPLRGQIRLRADGPAVAGPLRLDAAGRHHWWPRLPNARLEVDFAAHNLRWSGRGYHDINWGQEPLAHGFSRWDWMRQLGARGTAVDYRVVRRDGSSRATRLFFGRNGAVRRPAATSEVTVGRSFWGLVRRATSGWQLRRTLEDTPFYVRSQLRRRDGKAFGTAMHESLDMDRWRRRWVRFLLPFRLRQLPAISSRGDAFQLIWLALGSAMWLPLPW